MFKNTKISDIYISVSILQIELSSYLQLPTEQKI